jgi:hypothetical protein
MVIRGGCSQVVKAVACGAIIPRVRTPSSALTKKQRRQRFFSSLLCFFVIVNCTNPNFLALLGTQYLNLSDQSALELFVICSRAAVGLREKV